MVIIIVVVAFVMTALIMVVALIVIAVSMPVIMIVIVASDLFGVRLAVYGYRQQTRHLPFSIDRFIHHGMDDLKLRRLAIS